MRFESVRFVVFDFVEVHGRVCGVHVAGRRFDLLQASPLRQIRDVPGNVVPVLAAIVRNLDYAVVGADPNGFGIKRRNGERKNRANGFRAAQVEPDRTTAALLFRLVVAGEIGTNRRPMRAAVGGLKQDVAAQINLVRISGGHRDR